MGSENPLDILYSNCHLSVIFIGGLEPRFSQPECMYSANHYTVGHHLVLMIIIVFVLCFRQVWFTLPFGPLLQACWPRFKDFLWPCFTAYLTEM